MSEPIHDAADGRPGVTSSTAASTSSRASRRQQRVYAVVDRARRRPSCSLRRRTASERGAGKSSMGSMPNWFAKTKEMAAFDRYFSTGDVDENDAPRPVPAGAGPHARPRRSTTGPTRSSPSGRAAPNRAGACRCRSTGTSAATGSTTSTPTDPAHLRVTRRALLAAGPVARRDRPPAGGGGVRDPQGDGRHRARQPRLGHRTTATGCGRPSARTASTSTTASAASRCRGTAWRRRARTTSRSRRCADRRWSSSRSPLRARTATHDHGDGRRRAVRADRRSGGVASRGHRRSR